MLFINFVIMHTGSCIKQIWLQRAFRVEIKIDVFVVEKNSLAYTLGSVEMFTILILLLLI